MKCLTIVLAMLLMLAGSTQGAIVVSQPGDANLDGNVNVSDLGVLATNYGVGGGFEWGDGDFNGNGLVDVSDLGILATNYGNIYPIVVDPTNDVPEPSTFAIWCILGGLGMIAVRRRRQQLA